MRRLIVAMNYAVCVMSMDKAKMQLRLHKRLREFITVYDVQTQLIMLL